MREILFEGNSPHRSHQRGLPRRRTCRHISHRYQRPIGLRVLAPGIGVGICTAGPWPVVGTMGNVCSWGKACCPCGDGFAGLAAIPPGIAGATLSPAPLFFLFSGEIILISILSSSRASTAASGSTSFRVYPLKVSPTLRPTCRSPLPGVVRGAFLSLR